MKLFQLYPGKAKINVDVPNTATSPCPSLDSSISNRSLNDNSNANSVNGSPTNVASTSTAPTKPTATATPSSTVQLPSLVPSVDAHKGSEKSTDEAKDQEMNSESKAEVLDNQSQEDLADVNSKSINDRLSVQDDVSSPSTNNGSRAMSPNPETRAIEDNVGELSTLSSAISSDTLPLSLLQSSITIVVNKIKSASSSLGPFLDPKKVQELPQRFGPGSINRVLRRAVQELVDASIDQKQVGTQYYQSYILMITIKHIY